MRIRQLPLIAALLLLLGCITTPARINPSFPISIPAARSILTECSAHPKPLDRPLVIIGGFLDPGIAPTIMLGEFASYTRDRRIISVPLGLCFSFDGCRKKIIEKVDQAFPTKDPMQTTQVDVIGISMGGLAARYAAQAPSNAHLKNRRLNIVHLFTISSPLRGAVQADRTWLTMHPLQESMRANSKFLHNMQDAPESGADLYPIYSYVRLNDWAVGEQNAAVPGQTPWWVSAPPLSHPHNDAFSDARIIADILLRLRGQTPLTTDPADPLPGGK